MWFKAEKQIGLLGLWLALTVSARAEIKVGDAFPVLDTYRFEGALPADRTGKVLLVDFWASWCAPCHDSFPALSALQTELAARGFTIVGVSVDEKRAPCDAFVKRMNPTFSIVRDASKKLVADVKVPTMPTSYLIDRHGIVRSIHAGFHDGTEAVLRSEAMALLEEKP